MIGRPTNHHPVKPRLKMGAGIRQMLHTPIQAEMEAREHLFHPENQIIVQRRDIPVFFRAEPLQPSLAGMYDDPRHAGALNHG